MTTFSKRAALVAAAGLTVAAVAAGMSSSALAHSARPAAMKSKAVTIADFQFTPASIKVKRGQQVVWTNNGPSTHTTTSDTTNPDNSTGIGLWNSGDLMPPHTFSFTFTAAGTYTYHCMIHPFMTAKVIVPLGAMPMKGGTSTMFKLKIASTTAASGFVYDVQEEAPGGTFQSFMTTTQPTVTFHTTTSGTYMFRARMRRTSNNGASEYSPAVKVKVT